MASLLSLFGPLCLVIICVLVCLIILGSKAPILGHRNVWVLVCEYHSWQCLLIFAFSFGKAPSIGFNGVHIMVSRAAMGAAWIRP